MTMTPSLTHSFFLAVSGLSEMPAATAAGVLFALAGLARGGTFRFLFFSYLGYLDRKR